MQWKIHNLINSMWTLWLNLSANFSFLKENTVSVFVLYAGSGD